MYFKGTQNNGLIHFRVILFFFRMNIDDFIFQDPTFDSSESNDCVDDTAVVKRKNVKLKNRLAAKRFREKKDILMSHLEEENDFLRKEALRLTKHLMTLHVQNQYLEDDLKFFQSFLSLFMNH